MQQNAINETVLPSKVISLKMKKTTGIRIAICESLATINDRLNLSILRKIWSGNCCIHAYMKLAEKIMPNGKPRTKYGLDVYAGRKYATTIATI